MFTRLALILTFFLSPASFAQEVHVKIYNTDNGLPQNSVKDIVKDKYGFIWMSTEDGLVRYDGLKLKVYNKFPISNQRLDVFYGDIQKDSILTSAAGYNSILVNGRSAKLIGGDRVFTYIVKFQGKEYGEPVHSSKPVNFKPMDHIGNYMPFEKGEYFIDALSPVYREKVSGRERKINLQIPHKKLFDCFTLDEMLFYIDRETGGVVQLEEGNVTARYNFDLLTKPESKLIWSKINNQTFLIIDHNVYLFTFENGSLRMKKLLYLKEIENDMTVSVFYDKEFNRLYVGSTTEGLRVISFKDFALVKRKGRDTDTNNNFYSSLPYDSGSVINAYGEIYDRNGFREDKNFSAYTPYVMVYDANKNIIVRQHTTLMSYRRKDQYLKSDSISMKGIELVDFYNESDIYYSIWSKFGKKQTIIRSGLLTLSKGTFPGKIFKQFELDFEPTQIEKLDDEYLLVGTSNKLYKISLNTGKKYDMFPEMNVWIRNIIRTSDGNVWVLTFGKGFYLLRNDRLIPMPLSIDKNTASSHTILEDGKGFFWISTNNGLYKVKESELLKSVRNPGYQVNYYRFSKESGFSTNEFNGGGNVIGNILGNGEFVFPSLDGFIFFDPLNIKTYYPKNIYVERAVTEGKELHFTDTLTLEQSPYRTDILIDIPYYSGADNIFIQTRLGDSPETRWELIGKDRKVSLSNLPYGNHTLYVKVLASEDGDYIYKAITIIVPPYFYQTIWFKALCVLALAFLIYMSVRLRVNYLKKRNLYLEGVISSRTQKLSDTVNNLEETKKKLNKEIVQQKKLIGTITHDITTPVKFIALTTQELLNKKEDDREKIDKILNYVQKSSFQLYNFTKTLKEYADIYSHHQSHESEWYSLYELVEEKRILFNEIAQNNKTTILNHTDPEIITLISKNILSAIIHNLLDNSVKYTSNGTITIISREEDSTIILEITDTGIGMSEQKIEYYTWLQENIENEKLLLQKYGMGLHLVLQLLQMIEGKIVFKRNLVGTSFELILNNKR